MKNWNEMTNKQKVLSILGTVVAGPVAIPAIVGTAVAGATAVVATAPVSIPTGAVLAVTGNTIIENL